MNAEEMSGRGAVVTGAASGMGRSIALSLAKMGMNVVIADVDEEKAASVRDVARSLGVGSIAVRTDVSNLDAVYALADAAYAEFDDIAILVNNAGVAWRPYRASWDASLEDCKWLMDVNFWGVFNGHHVFVPRMRELGGRSHIVNTSSFATLLVGGGNAAYAAAKAAVNAFSLAARAEYQSAGLNIDVSILYPGAVQTAIASSERLRPMAERSATRNVREWDAYLAEDAPRIIVTSEPASDPRDVTHFAQMIDPDWVGEMVVRAIIDNRTFILTHPAPDDLRTRFEELFSAYVPPSL